MSLAVRTLSPPQQQPPTPLNPEAHNQTPIPSNHTPTSGTRNAISRTFSPNAAGMSISTSTSTAQDDRVFDRESLLRGERRVGEDVVESLGGETSRKGLDWTWGMVVFCSISCFDGMMVLWIEVSIDEEAQCLKEMAKKTTRSSTRLASLTHKTHTPPTPSKHQ
jgi:hypothetical protein